MLKLIRKIEKKYKISRRSAILFVLFSGTEDAPF